MYQRDIAELFDVQRRGDQVVPRALVSHRHVLRRHPGTSGQMLCVDRRSETRPASSTAACPAAVLASRAGGGFIMS